MKITPKKALVAWAVLLLSGAGAAYYYIKVSSTPIFSITSTKEPLDGYLEGQKKQSWLDRLREKSEGDLYPAVEVAYDIDMNEPKEEGKEFYYILSISNLSEEKFRIVEKKLNSLRLLYSLKKTDSGFSVNVSLKDKESMQKLVDELKKLI